MSGWSPLLRGVYVAFVILIYGGVAAIPFRPYAGVALIMVGLIGYVGTHLVVGVVHYRQVMRRPWPLVPPIEDDDDW